MSPIRKSLTDNDTMNIFVGVISCFLLRTPAMKQKLIKMLVTAVRMFIVTRMEITAADIGPTAGRIKQAIILIS